MAGGEQSTNFGFLAARDPQLYRCAALAERYFSTDPNSALLKLRQFGELLAAELAARTGAFVPPDGSFLDTLNALRLQGLPPRPLDALFHDLRRAGNKAAHEYLDSQREALHQLKAARRLAIWYHHAVVDKHYKAGPFQPPPDPNAATNLLKEELAALRELAVKAQASAEAASAQALSEAEERAAAEARAAAAAEEARVALELAQETEQASAEREAAFAAQLASLRQEAEAPAPAEVQARVAAALAAANDEAVQGDEADARVLVDQQLRAAGWDADTIALRWSRGVRPQKGRNLAIAEVPTDSGPVDYVLYIGLVPVAIVEAKRASKNVPGVLAQSKRYARGLKPQDGVEPAGPWGDYRVPFLFATNGRPHLRQVAEASGTWFLDARRPENHGRAAGFYSPSDLQALLDQDVAEAEQRMRDEPVTDLEGLRDYQYAAISAVEGAILDGRRAVLLSMATGTGKTRTAIGLVYRLIKTNRFRRVLFLVDRSALGQQATDAFSTVPVESLQSFASIYDLKEMKAVEPESDTRLQIATVQAMVKRVLHADDDEAPLAASTYDCIIIDECHRGYVLDKEMTAAELAWRNQDDYVGTYRQVLDHFDAVTIGLTATPALHTTQIFGEPVFEYGYRQAVIEGRLIDHEPPVRIVTGLSEDGISWKAGEEVSVYRTRTRDVVRYETPDEIDLDIDSFNQRVRTENFNRVVCRELANHIDPSLPGKTLVFCTNDDHADVVVRLLKEAFDEAYGGVDDGLVRKITGQTDKPMETYRIFKNEPNQLKVAVTVDLLTTGIDVPEIVNLVFLRRVRSRILYEQMIGRATRRCDAIGKEVFHIFDAVELYDALAAHTNVAPVVVQPKLTFAQLAAELEAVDDVDARAEFHAQLQAKLQRKVRRLTDVAAEQFQQLTGSSPQDAADLISHQSPDESRAWFAAHPGAAPFLDKVLGEQTQILISEHEDAVRRVEHGYGKGQKPEDYLSSFGAWVRENLNSVPALKLVTTKPRDLTRQQLVELKLALDAEGFNEATLRTAWRDVTNQEIAASILGFIRQQALGDPLVPYEVRVDKALARVLARQAWTKPQRTWLERIGNQLRAQSVVDRRLLDEGSFKDQGGFDRLNRVFGGELEQVLGDLNEAVWEESG